MLPEWFKGFVSCAHTLSMAGAERKKEKKHQQDVAHLCYRISLLNNEIEQHEDNRKKYDLMDIDDELSRKSVERFNSAILAMKSGISLNDVVEMYELNHSEMELMQIKYSISDEYYTTSVNRPDESN